MAAAPNPEPHLNHTVSRDWIEHTYVYIVEEALYGTSKTARLSVAAATLDKLARFKGLIVERHATLSASIGSMDRAAVKTAAVEMLEQLEPGARAEMKRLLARSDSTFTDTTDKV